MEQSNYTTANQGLRLANFIIDTFAYLTIWIILTVILMIMGLDQTYTDNTVEEIPLIPMIIIIPSFWGYYIICEYFTQKTLGKLITKTVVVNTSGKKPSFGQILGRTLSRSIPFEYLSYIFTRNGIHDLLPKTRVILKQKNVS